MTGALAVGNAAHAGLLFSGVMERPGMDRRVRHLYGGFIAVSGVVGAGVSTFVLASDDLKGAGWTALGASGVAAGVAATTAGLLYALQTGETEVTFAPLAAGVIVAGRF
jgi:hypothetical protein